MNRETKLALLNKFVSKDRHSMSKPFIQELSIGKYLCATDTHVAILIPDSGGIELVKDDSIKPPNINYILPGFTDTAVLDIDRLKQIYDEVPMVEQPIMGECDSCDGDGEFEHYGFTYECEKCNSEGEIKTSQNETVKHPNTVVEINELHISLTYIKSIIEVVSMCGAKSIKVVAIHKNTLWLLIDNFYVCICGMLILDRPEYNIIKY